MRRLAQFFGALNAQKLIKYHIPLYNSLKKDQKNKKLDRQSSMQSTNILRRNKHRSTLICKLFILNLCFKQDSQIRILIFSSEIYNYSKIK